MTLCQCCHMHTENASLFNSYIVSWMDDSSTGLYLRDSWVTLSYTSPDSLGIAPLFMDQCIPWKLHSSQTCFPEVSGLHFPYVLTCPFWKAPIFRKVLFLEIVWLTLWSLDWKRWNFPVRFHTYICRHLFRMTVAPRRGLFLWDQHMPPCFGFEHTFEEVSFSWTMEAVWWTTLFHSGVSRVNTMAYSLDLSLTSLTLTMTTWKLSSIHYSQTCFKR